MPTLHVDDGTLAGERSNRIYKKTLAGINGKFNIKEWHDLLEGTDNYLGTRWRQDAEIVALGMGECIDSLEEMSVRPASGDLPILNDEEVYAQEHVGKGTVAGEPCGA